MFDGHRDLVKEACLIYQASFFYGDEENRHCACTSEYLATANQIEIRKEYLGSAC